MICPSWTQLNFNWTSDGYLFLANKLVRSRLPKTATCQLVWLWNMVIGLSHCYHWKVPCNPDPPGFIPGLTLTLTVWVLKPFSHDILPLFVMSSQPRIWLPGDARCPVLGHFSARVYCLAVLGDLVLRCTWVITLMPITLLGKVGWNGFSQCDLSSC